MAASGATNKEMAEAVKMSVMSMNNALKKFHKYGIDVALADIQRSGRPCVIDEFAISWIYSLAKRKPCELTTSDGKAEEPEELEEVEENKSVEKIKDAEELWNLRRLQKYVRGHCAQHGHNCLEKISISKLWTIIKQGRKTGRFFIYSPKA
jgi:transposase